MDIKAIRDELKVLVREFDNQPEDPRELYLQLHEKLSEMRAFGMPVPQDLLELEEKLQADFGPPLATNTSGKA